MHCTCGQENPISTSKCPRCGKTLVAGMDPRRLAIDIGVGVGLMLALALVFLFDRGHAKPTDGAAGDGNKAQVKVVEGSESPSLAQRLRLALTPPEYDDMGKMLDTLGAGYRYTTISMDDLLDARRLKEFDVVFVTCGTVPRDWVGRRKGESGRDGGGVHTARPKVVDELRRSLQEFVADGGTLYLSDWHYQLVAIAFPEFVSQSTRTDGAIQTVHAEVADSGLRKQMGSSLDLRFDKPSWQPATFLESKVTTLLRGTFRTTGGVEMTSPLLVQFPVEKGNVIFTSFHNEAQNSQTEQQLLRYLVFTTVTAQLDASIKRTMMSGGFSPVDRNLLSASTKDQSVTETYEHRGTRPLQFVLGFESRGAELRLTVVGPDGRQLEKSGTSTITIDVPEAVPGKWQYTVTPVKVPYQNFPFSLTVGEKQ